ncbi:MAG TPA: ABC transporter ATP-binding protein [Acetobacteraceae bacterium]|nr:ABC transporter ATP-binding protein [Acetobacteraceae bacterium]
MAEIALAGICKTYVARRREVRALAPLDLTIRDGEFVTVLGPSGSGKTTLLSLIVGTIAPSGGRILVDGADVTYADLRARDMAMVFQNYALYPAKTVRGNLDFPLRMRGVARAERAPRVDAMARLLGLTELLDQYPRQLSGGQQQRVALGRALIRRPKLFLMDEPLSNLDAKLRLQMRTEIKRLHREVPVTTVYVTHDQIEAMSLSDRVVVMNQGHVVQVDTPEAIYNRPADLFVAGFVGAPAMNMFRVSLRSAGGGLVCRLDGGSAAASLRPHPPVAAGNGVLGIRPKHVEWQTQAGPVEPPRLGGVVREIDDTGDDRLIYADIGQEPVTILETRHRSVAVGEPIAIRFPEPSVHLFVDGRRVEAAPAPAPADTA